MDKKRNDIEAANNADENILSTKEMDRTIIKTEQQHLEIQRKLDEYFRKHPEEAEIPF